MHRSVYFDVVNTSPRGPATPPAGTVHRLRWQAVCSILQMPWVSVREAGNMSHYASGDLPQPGTSRQAAFWLFPVDLNGMPDVTGLPATLNLACKITVGAFLPNVPVVHTGDPIPHPDWGMPSVWWTQSVMLTLPNPEAR
jgi:hypothetical protein